MAHENYQEQMRNLNLFLKGKRLEKTTLSLYTYLFRKACIKKDYNLDTTLKVIALSIGWGEDLVLKRLNELKKLNLFNRIENINGALLIHLKDLENYARATS